MYNDIVLRSATRAATVAVALVLGTAAPSAARAEASEARAETALIVKGGSVTLAKDRQNIPGGLAIFDEKSASAFGGELEWRKSTGVAFGVEVLFYDHDFLNADSEVQSAIVMGNVKKYFLPSKAIHPYVGAGLGVASVELSGGGSSGTGSGLAVQAVAGLELRTQKVGLYTEVKYLSAKAEDSEGNDVDASGTGVFAGISIFF